MPNPIKRVEYVCLTLNESVYAKPNYLGSRMRKKNESSCMDGVKTKEL